MQAIKYHKLNSKNLTRTILFIDLDHVRSHDHQGSTICEEHHQGDLFHSLVSRQFVSSIHVCFLLFVVLLVERCLSVTWTSVSWVGTSGLPTSTRRVYITYDICHMNAVLWFSNSKLICIARISQDHLFRVKPRGGCPQVPTRGKALEGWSRPSIDELGVPTEAWSKVQKSFLPQEIFLIHQTFNVNMYVCPMIKMITNQL